MVKAQSAGLHLNKFDARVLILYGGSSGEKRQVLDACPEGVDVLGGIVEQIAAMKTLDERRGKLVREQSDFSCWRLAAGSLLDGTNLAAAAVSEEISVRGAFYKRGGKED